MKKIFLILGMTSFLTSCYRDVKTIKIQAPEFLKQRGYTIVSYDGYESDIIAGGFVAYVVKDKQGFIYQIEITEWKGEFHIYNRICLNAVSTN
jgi:hypothetical protein